MTDWTPQFPGQRPPFEQGHTLSLRSGAESPRTINPLAEEIEHRARTDPSWPQYLNSPEYGGAVSAWAKAEAVSELLWRHLCEMDIGAALDETTEEDEEETRAKGRRKRISTGRRTMATFTAWQKAASAAAYHRGRLGLDPTSRAKLSKDIAATTVQVGLAQMQVGGAELVERARASGALTGPTPAPAEAVTDDHGAAEGPQRTHRP